VGAVVLLRGKGAEFTESGANISAAPRETANPIAIPDLFVIRAFLRVSVPSIMAEKRGWSEID